MGEKSSLGNTTPSASTAHALPGTSTMHTGRRYTSSTLTDRPADWMTCVTRRDLGHPGVLCKGLLDPVHQIVVHDRQRTVELGIAEDLRRGSSLWIQAGSGVISTCSGPTRYSGAAEDPRLEPQPRQVRSAAEHADEHHDDEHRPASASSQENSRAANGTRSLASWRAHGKGRMSESRMTKE